MRTVFSQLAAWWRARSARPAEVTMRYVRKPKVIREVPRYTGRHRSRDVVLTARRTVTRAAQTVRVAVQPRHGRRRAPSGVAVMLRRAHGIGAREKTPARSRISDLTGQIPRRIAYHGERVRWSLRNDVRDWAWTV